MCTPFCLTLTLDVSILKVSKRESVIISFYSLVTHVIFEYTTVIFIDLVHFNLGEVWVHFSVSIRHAEDSWLPGMSALLPPCLHIIRMNHCGVLLKQKFAMGNATKVKNTSTCGGRLSSLK